MDSRRASDVLSIVPRWAGRARRWLPFALALRRSLRHPMSLDDAVAIVRRRLEDRETNFLSTVERNIYGYPNSPYLPLLRRAGCEFPDLVAMVRGHGLEHTLKALHDAGVYVTFEEFKGRQPLVRNELVMNVRPGDFTNPSIRDSFSVLSGGTTGRAVQAPMNLAHIAAQAPIEMLSFAANNLLDTPVAIWWSVYGGYGMTIVVRGAHHRVPLARWFSPTTGSDYKAGEWDRMNDFLIMVLRFSGVPVPRPETVRLDEAEVIA